MKKKSIILFFITIIILAIILYRIDGIIFWETLKNFETKKIFIIFFVFVISFFVRGARWKLLLMNSPKYSVFNLSEIFVVGNLLNIFLPARAGDLYRAYYLGEQYNDKKLKILGSIILERIFDGIAIFSILLISILIYSKAQLIFNITIGIGLFFICSLFFALWVFRTNKIKDIYRFLITKIKQDKIKYFIKKITIYTKIFMTGFSAFKNTFYLFNIFILSVFAWSLESLVAYIILSSFGTFKVPIIAGAFVMSLTSFSTMIPSTSVLIGPYQGAYILALELFDIGKSQALAIATVNQLIIIAVFSLLGGICMLKFNLKAIKNYNE